MLFKSSFKTDFSNPYYFRYRNLLYSIIAYQYWCWFCEPYEDSFSRLLDVFFHESTLGMMIFLILESKDYSFFHYSLYLFYDSIEKLHRNSMAVDIQMTSCALKWTVFCFKIVLPFSEKTLSSNWEKLDQLIWTEKGQNNFWNIIFS